MPNKNILRLTTTAVLVALLIGIQAAAGALGQLAVGSLVNLVLVMSVMIGGLASGLAAALLSPVFARLLGIGPLWALVPFIMAGNAALILVWHFVAKRDFAGRHIVRATALALAAVCKFAVLYLGIVRIAAPFLLRLPAPQTAMISNMFALPQLLTALIGGALAMAVLPVAEKVRKG